MNTFFCCQYQGPTIDVNLQALFRFYKMIMSFYSTMKWRNLAKPLYFMRWLTSSIIFWSLLTDAVDPCWLWSTAQYSTSIRTVGSVGVATQNFDHSAFRVKKIVLNLDWWAHLEDRAIRAIIYVYFDLKT